MSLPVQAPLLLMGPEEAAIYGGDAEVTGGDQGAGEGERPAKRQCTRGAGSDSDVSDLHISARRPPTISIASSFVADITQQQP